MDLKHRNRVNVSGDGPFMLMFAHGYGCDQNMWRFLAPAFQDRYRTLLFDQVGSGASDLSAYDPAKYDALDGYAADVLELIDAYAEGRPVVFVGHSVSAMTGLIAGIRAPERFAGHVMVSPSPCYIDDGDYKGGFTREQIDELLETLESNYLGWSSATAPAIMGAPDRPELGQELANSFCRTDPEIAKQFARVTFLTDCRAQLPLLKAPTLVLQCTDDFIAPPTVGQYMKDHLPDCELVMVENHGHCPHMSAPSASAEAMNRFLSRLSGR
jgi:sigma-B regulation protein RsbQ